MELFRFVFSVFYKTIACCLYPLDQLIEAILMSIHNLRLHDKIRKKSLNFTMTNICFLGLSEAFPRVRISHSKRVIGDLVLEV